MQNKKGGANASLCSVKELTFLSRKKNAASATYFSPYISLFVKTVILRQIKNTT